MQRDSTRRLNPIHFGHANVENNYIRFQFYSLLYRFFRYVPPPQGIPAPVLWGVENVVKERPGGYASKTETARRAITFDYPLPPRQVVQFFREYFGPAQMAFSRLDAAGQSALAADLEKLWSEHNKGENGRTLVSAEYLEVTATRA